MDSVQIDVLVRQLATGFEALQDEYQKLFGQHQALERKLANAREQYNELARQYGAGQTATPPLSLASFPGPPKTEVAAPLSVGDILEKYGDLTSRTARDQVKAAAAALPILRAGIPSRPDSTANGVRIWAGPSADKPDSSLPSIQESPLEQDFTIEGKPSKLGCPFASMSKRRLSSHAASVLSRYNHTGSVCAASNFVGTASPMRPRDSRSSRHGSIADPIQAEICAMSDNLATQPSESKEDSATKKSASVTAEAGVCPIRFLDQHSPEEVATYFERHKHELPRSHEVCVRRYQSNEEQIRELDAKYGNLVSMIQGLGMKHKDLLPPEPEDEDDLDHPALEEIHDAASDEKVRKWASSVTAQAAESGDATLAAVAEHSPTDDEDMFPDEDRVSHFERPLRDIRVGESPSRPWGIPVPIKYLEQVPSEGSSKPAAIATPSPSPLPDHTTTPAADDPPISSPPHPLPQTATGAKCPFAHLSATVPAPHPVPQTTPAAETTKAAINHTRNPTTNTTAATIDHPNPAPQILSSASAASTSSPPLSRRKHARMIFTGPVFIGYSPDDAIRLLRETGLGS